MSTTPTNSSVTAGAGAGLHVLVVDDDAFTQELLGSMLRKLGVTRISTAADGERGVAALQASAPDLVMCDLNMPGKDGFQVMEAMAAADYPGAVVLMSGLNERMLQSAGLMARFHKLKMLGLLPKPVSRQALSDLLSRATHARV